MYRELISYCRVKDLQCDSSSKGVVQGCVIERNELHDISHLINLHGHTGQAHNENVENDQQKMISRSPK